MFLIPLPPRAVTSLDLLEMKRLPEVLYGHCLVIVPVQSRSRSKEQVNKPKTARGSAAQTCSDTPQFCPPTSLTHDPSCEESKPGHSRKSTEKPARQKTKTERGLKSIKYIKSIQQLSNHLKSIRAKGLYERQR